MVDGQVEALSHTPNVGAASLLVLVLLLLLLLML